MSWPRQRSSSAADPKAEDAPVGVNVLRPFRVAEKAAVLAALDDGWISSEGPRVRDFENRVAARVGRRCGVACSSGTAALDLAFAALKVGPGDEVIMPTLAIISCASQVARSGATMVFVDSREDFNLDVQKVERLITSRTKAILAVHTYSFPCDMDALLKVADARGIPVVEDAAELIGNTHRGRAIGSFGLISTMSFYPNKHVTTGEGGMVLTDDPDLAERCRRLRNLCFDPNGRRFVHEELGWNYRLTNLQAALGCAQLDELDATLARKVAIGRRYSAKLSGCPGLALPPDAHPVTGDPNSYWVYPVVLADGFPDAEEVMLALGVRKVGTRPFFWPLHEQPVFASSQRPGVGGRLLACVRPASRFPTAERLARRGFYLPSGLGTSDAQIDAVALRVREVMSSFANAGNAAERR